VNAVVPDEELDAEVDRWCTEILRRSPQGLRLAKLALNAATDQIYSAVQHGLELVASTTSGAGAQGGIASFQEKRPADWRKFRDGQAPSPRRSEPVSALAPPLEALRRACARSSSARSCGERLGRAERSRWRGRRRGAAGALGGGGWLREPGPPAGGHLLAQGLHPAHQPLPDVCSYCTFARATTTRARTR